MRLKLKCEFEDGTVENVTATVPDLIAWERKFNTKISALTDGVRVEDLAFMAWNSLKRQGLTTLAFDAWSNGLVDLEQIEDKEPRPTKPEA